MTTAAKRVSADILATPSLGGRVTESGRLSLPAEVRRLVGLEKGGPVRIDLVDGSIRIRTMREIEDHILALARDTGLTEKASLKDFLEWRASERAAETKAVSRRT